MNGSRFVWSENAGWINAQSSGFGGPGVQVDEFKLSGWMWAENLGWISLDCSNRSSCGTVNYGVDNSGGVLTGYAWSENVGWISFDSSGVNPFQLETSWTCSLPIGSPDLTMTKLVGSTQLSWSPLPGVLAFDVTRGDLDGLRTTRRPTPSNTRSILLREPVGGSSSAPQIVAAAATIPLEPSNSLRETPVLEPPGSNVVSGNNKGGNGAGASG